MWNINVFERENKQETIISLDTVLWHIRLRKLQSKLSLLDWRRTLLLRYEAGEHQEMSSIIQGGPERMQHLRSLISKKSDAKLN